MRTRASNVLVAILAIMPLAVVWFAYQTSGASITEVQRTYGRALYKAAAEDAASATAEYIAPGARAASRSASQLATGIVDPSDPDAVDTYLRTTLDADPGIVSMTWYRSDGAIHETSRDGSRFESSFYDPTVEDPVVTTTRRTLTGGVVSVSDRNGVLTVADPVLLRLAEVEGTAVSDVWVTDDGIPVITFAATAWGPAGGSVFVDFDVAGVGDLLSEYESQASSRVFVVSRQDLIAHSRPELIGDASAGTTVADLSDVPTIQAGMLALGGDGWQLLEIDDEPYHAVTDRVESTTGVDWTVVAVGRNDDFASDFRDVRTRDRGFFVAIAVISIVLAIVLALTAMRDFGSLHRAAHRDSLTGLLNRRTFEKHATAVIAAARRRRRSVGALMVDIDHFKQLNDTYGHHAGDEILEAVAGRISHSVAKTDLVARLGGDELALLLDGADLAATQSVANRLRNAVTQSPISTNRGPVYVTVSIGASATNAVDRARFEDVMKAADRALYTSKRAGRDRITAVEMARTH